MADHRLGQSHEGRRYAHRPGIDGRIGRQGITLEGKTRFAASFMPVDFIRQNSSCGKGASRLAPLLEIPPALQNDTAHHSSDNCSGCGSNIARRSGRSARRRGVQPSAVMKACTLRRETPSRGRSSSRNRRCRLSVRIAFTVLVPSPGTRRSFSRSARLISTGKSSRWPSAQASLGSRLRSSMPPCCVEVISSMPKP